MIDTDKYEGLIDAEGYIDYDGLDHLLAEVKRLRKGIKAYLQIIDERPPFNVDYREKLRELIE
tara:strand:- start:464 stop:652 length:189 start_codon:yes stop_codon:yes gene_type:complete